MKIYFAGSIRGGRDDVGLYKKIIQLLREYGEVLTEHIADNNLNNEGEKNKDDVFIHDRDMKWILESDIIIAEVTNPSLGVGYEIGRAIEHNKNIICLYRKNDKNRLSAMIAGARKIKLINYEDFLDLNLNLKRILIKYFLIPLLSIQNFVNWDKNILATNHP